MKKKYQQKRRKKRTIPNRRLSLKKKVDTKKNAVIRNVLVSGKPRIVLPIVPGIEVHHPRNGVRKIEGVNQRIEVQSGSVSRKTENENVEGKEVIWRGLRRHAD